MVHNGSTSRSVRRDHKVIRDETVLDPGATENSDARECCGCRLSATYTCGSGATKTTEDSDRRFQFEFDAAGKLSSSRPTGNKIRRRRSDRNAKFDEPVHLIAGRIGYEQNAWQRSSFPNLRHVAPVIESVLLYNTSWDPFPSEHETRLNLCRTRFGSLSGV